MSKNHQGLSEHQALSICTVIAVGLLYAAQRLFREGVVEDSSTERNVSYSLFLASALYFCPVILGLYNMVMDDKANESAPRNSSMSLRGSR